MPTSIGLKVIAETPAYHEPMTKARTDRELQVMKEYRGPQATFMEQRAGMTRDAAIRRYR
jgi:hypothetical protein